MKDEKKIVLRKRCLGKSELDILQIEAQDSCKNNKALFYEQYVKRSALTDNERFLFERIQNGWTLAPFRGLHGKAIWMKEKKQRK